jgi:8-oxo-dGTP diphosphatase
MKDRFKLLSAVHIFLIRSGRVLLLRRFNTGYEDGKYSVIAGHLDGNEPVEKAAIREAREEAGIEIAPRDLQVVGVMHRRSEDERIDFFLTATSWAGEVRNCEPHRCDRLAWFDLERLPDNVVPYVGRALENYRRGVWFDSFGWTDPDRKATPSTFDIRPLHADDRDWVSRLIAQRWAAEQIVVHGAAYVPADLPGFVAVQDEERAGLITYHVEGRDCEIVTLDSLRPGIGIGSALIEAVGEAAGQAGCRRLWLVTTNDNLDALRFYQRRGFELVAVHRGAVERSRSLKPEIPLVGAHGLPLRDEIELELLLGEAA